MTSQEADRIMEEIEAKEGFSIEDRYELDRILASPMEDYFSSKLSPKEKIQVQQIEINNLIQVLELFLRIIDNQDPTSFSDSSHIAEIKEGIEDECENCTESEKKLMIIGFILMYQLSILSESNNPIKPKVIGKIPKSGFICTRQVLANDWLNDFLNTRIQIMRLIAKKTNNDKEILKNFLFANVGHYLLKNMPNRFAPKPNESQNETIGRVLNEFTNART